MFSLLDLYEEDAERREAAKVAKMGRLRRWHYETGWQYTVMAVVAVLVGLIALGIWDVIQLARSIQWVN